MKQVHFARNHSLEQSLRNLALVCATVSVLGTGCGGGSSASDDTSGRHSHSDITSAGRMVIYDQDSASLKVMDMESESILSTYLLPGDTPRLYSSPGNRYAVIIQRSDNLVSFLDSGLYTEDHGDHIHEYAEDPAFLDFTLPGSRPTHYTSHDEISAVFFDAQEGITSSVTLFSDSDIGNGEISGDLTLTNNMHGVAKLIDDQLFVTYRDPLIVDTTLPAEVERYSFNDGAFLFEHRYEEECPRLHGSAANEDFIAFGCSDGVLAVNLSDPAYPAVKVENPESLADESRIGSLYAHHDVSEFVGVAGNQFYVIDPADSSDPYHELSLPDDVSRIAQGFAAKGKVFYILGDDGKLYLFNVNSDWESIAPVDVADAVGDGDVSPAITISRSEDKLFVLNTNGQQIIEVDSANGNILKTIDLEFTASTLVWLGLSESGEHDHDHDH